MPFSDQRECRRRSFTFFRSNGYTRIGYSPQGLSKAVGSADESEGWEAEADQDGAGEAGGAEWDRDQAVSVEDRDPG